jgi:outer membrane protein assembly factor BamB
MTVLNQRGPIAASLRAVVFSGFFIAAAVPAAAQNWPSFRGPNAADGRYIVALPGSEGLFCFDMDGALKWRTDLGVMDVGLVGRQAPPSSTIGIR